MELRSFYEALLPSQGSYALFHVPTRRHVWCESFDELVAATEAKASEHSWYYAVGSFLSHKREQANVLAKRALYLDIDCGAEKYEKHPHGAYPTVKDGIAALLAFCQEFSVPPSILVGSGGGLHAYWALDSDVAPEVWQPLAEQLKQATKASGLKADPTCTADSARVLRPVGALHKNGNRVQVLLANGKTWTPEELASSLPAPAVIPVAYTPRSPVERDINDDVLGGFEGPPVSALKIAEKCPALAEVAAKRGDVPEPLWRAMIGIVKHTIEEAPQAHAWSDGYAGYTFEETQDKYDRYGAGPTTCAKFEEHSSACANCEHRGKIKSPIVLGKLTVKQTAALPTPVAETPPPPPPAGIPDIFGKNFAIQIQNGKEVLVYRRVIEDDDGEGTTRSIVWPVLTYEPFWFDEWVDAGNGETESARSRLVRRVGGRIEGMDFDDSLVADRRAMLKFLASKNIRPASFDGPTTIAMQTYVNEQLQRIRSTQARPVIRDRFGFQFDKTGQFVCAQGEHVIYGDGSIRRALLSQDMLVHVGLGSIKSLPENDTGLWSKEVWNTHIIPAARQQVEFLKRWYGGPEFPVAQLAIAAHLGAPLMCFTANSVIQPNVPLPPVGATVSLYSANSGRGKTTAMHAASAAFGAPEIMVHRGSKGGTTKNAASARVAAIGTGAFDLDEVTRDVAEDVAEFIDTIASGTDKLRANIRGKVARSAATFSALAFVSTNMPQRDLLASIQANSDALQQRLIELNFDAQPAISREAFTAYMEAFPTDMAPHFGALGAVIHLACVAQGAAKMQAQLNKSMIQAAELLGAEAKERFVVRVLACVLHVQELLAKVGLVAFETSTLIEQFKIAVASGRDASVSSTVTPLDQMRRMLAELSGHFILSNSESVGDRVDTVENIHSLRFPVKGRQVRVGRYTYVGVDAIRLWCRQNGCSFSQMMQDARAAGALMPVGSSEMEMVNITKGVTGVTQVRMPCVKVSHVALYGEEATPPNVVDLHKPQGEPGAQEQRSVPRQG